MYSVCGLCIAVLLIGCMPDAAQESQWDGTYIGYYHRNQQDTMPVTLVFEGKYFAASPYGKQAEAESTGVFLEDRSSLIFRNIANEAELYLDGAYQYQFGTDGSVRMWQQNGKEMNEMILRLK